MNYMKPSMEIEELGMTDIIVTSPGLSDKGDNDEDTGGGGVDLSGTPTGVNVF